MPTDALSKRPAVVCQQRLVPWRSSSSASLLVRVPQLSRHGRQPAQVAVGISGSGRSKGVKIRNRLPGGFLHVNSDGKRAVLERGMPGSDR